MESVKERPADVKHTRGPWRWFDYPSGSKLLAGVERAVIHCPDAPMTVDPADAALIAAAPDLLAACKSLIDAPHERHFAVRMNDQEMVGIDAIKAAIAKAEGRS